jgi:AraC-like DNA-binding protein
MFGRISHDMESDIRSTVIIGPRCRERILPLASDRLAPLAKRGVGFSGTSLLRGRYEIRRSGYRPHLLLYTLGGSGWLRTEGRDLVLRPGSVWICPQGTAHEYGLAGKSWEILWVSLADRAPWSVVRELGTVVRDSTWGGELKRAMEGLLRELCSDTREARTAVQLHSELLALHAERELGVRDDPMSRDIVARFERLKELVGSRLQEPWTVERLAAASGLFLSPDHFARVCTRHTGLPPLAMLTDLRMDRARELLRSSGYPVQEIGRLVGYTNPFAFSTAFKRLEGRSPRTYRGADHTPVQ